MRAARFSVAASIAGVLVTATVVTEAQYGAAARVTRDEFDSAQSETRVDRERAERTAAGNAGDRLEAAEGVVVQRTSSASAAPIVRGLTGYQVLLTLDELRLNDSLTRPGGNALLNLIDAESIEQIEVVRGPASVVHGSDALGGFVHVTTRRAGAHPGNAPDGSATVYLRGASAERELRVQGGVHAVADLWGARLSFGRGHAGRRLRGGDLGEQPFTGHDDWSFASRLEAAPSRHHHFTFSHQSGHLFDVPRSDVSVPDDVEITKRLDRESAVLSYRGRFPESALRVHVWSGLSLRREWRQRLRPADVRDERERVLSYQNGASLSTTPWRRASLELGGVAVLEDIASNRTTTEPGAEPQRGRGRYVDGSRYDTYGLYGLLSQGLSESLTLLVGTRATLVRAKAPIDPLFDPELGAELRLDQRLFGAVGSAGVRCDVADDLSLVASLLSGFRAPNLEDFQALGGGARGYSLPNPKLEEERSYTLETGIKRRGAIAFEAYVFGSLLDGLIVRVPSTLDGMSEVDGAPVQTRLNASHALMFGGELSAAARHASGLLAGVSAWATWGRATRPDLDGNDVTEPASKVPPPTGSVHVGYEPDAAPYWLRAQLLTALPQHRLSEGDRGDVRICEQGPDDCDRVAGYSIVNLRAGLRLDTYATLTLGLENLFDAGYKTFASGAYAEGRNFVLALRGTL